MLEIVTQKEASKMVGVFPNTIRYWISSGLLPAEKSGGIVMIRISDLEEANKRSMLNPERKRSKKEPVEA